MSFLKSNPQCSHESTRIHSAAKLRIANLRHNAAGCTSPYRKAIPTRPHHEGTPGQHSKTQHATLANDDRVCQPTAEVAGDVNPRTAPCHATPSSSSSWPRLTWTRTGGPGLPNRPMDPTIQTHRWGPCTLSGQPYIAVRVAGGGGRDVVSQP